MPGIHYRLRDQGPILLSIKGCLFIAGQSVQREGRAVARLHIPFRAIGTAHDLWTAYREDAFGKQPRPFVGWLMMVEDAPKSTSPVKNVSPHFPVLNEFKGTSYIQRYDLLCQRLVKEQLYTNAALITSKRSAVSTGAYSEISAMTGPKAFVSAFAGHVAAKAARLE